MQFDRQFLESLDQAVTALRDRFSKAGIEVVDRPRLPELFVWSGDRAWQAIVLFAEEAERERSELKAFVSLEILHALREFYRGSVVL